MTTASWIYQELDSRAIVCEVLQHADAFTAQEVAHAEHVSGHRVAKVVAVMANGRPVELILPASRRVNLERVGELLGARDVRLASEVELADYFTDCEVGAIPALRHWRDVEVIMDGHLRCDGGI